MDNADLGRRRLAIRIAVRAVPMPLPGAGDDLCEIGLLRAPAKFIPDTRRRGNKTWGVTGSASGLADRDRVARDSARRLDDLPHRIAFAIPQVVDQLVVIGQSIERQ